MAIWLPERDVWTQQPVGTPRINWGNPFAQGLFRVFVPGAAWIDCVTGGIQSYTDARPWLSSGKGGRSSYNNNLSTRYGFFQSSYFYPHASETLTGATDMTALVVVETPSNSQSTFCYDSNGNTVHHNGFGFQDVREIHFGIASGGAQWYFQHADGALPINGGAAVNKTNNAVQILGARVTSTPDMTLYVHGVGQNTVSHAAIKASARSTSHSIWHGCGDAPSNRAFVGHIYLFASWRYAMPEQLLLKLMHNPWQIFE